MKIEYALLIHEIIERGLDPKHLTLILERCDTNQIHELASRLDIACKEYDDVSDNCKDRTIREVALLPISDRIAEIQKQIEEL